MDEDKPFAVRDRRKFTAEGERREASDDEATAPAPTPQQTEAPRPEPSAPLPGDDPQVDFAGFLVSLATQASLLLSHPEGDPLEGLRGARHFISILEMLEDKTRGRRTGEEDQLLEQLLYDLRMAYVERARAVQA